MNVKSTIDTEIRERLAPSVLETGLQASIGEAVEWQGVGLHSGEQISCKLVPAKEDTGLVFCRTDLANTPTIPALAEYVVCTDRSTTLAKGEASVATVEHILAALYGAGIDNALIEINGPEVPILDGSAAPFYQAIQKVGLQHYEKPKKRLTIDREIKVSTQDGTQFMQLGPGAPLSLEATIDFNSRVLPETKVRFSTEDSFESELAPARTFVFLHELHWLIHQGLVKGGSLENAVVYIEHQPEELTLQELSTFFNSGPLTVNGRPILNSEPLRFSNEAARHKLLDILGDLALCGFQLEGKLTALRPGHALNVAFAKKIREIYAHE